MKNDKLIEHLSREIESLGNNLMSFRAKIAFTIYIGPFLILGAIIAASKANFSLSLDQPIWLSVSTTLSIACYLGLGHIAGCIEKQGWEQCNK